MQTIVIGHRNPDTDAICSAIAYAEFKRKMGMADVVAARAGDTNERIDFVLKKFGFPAPDFLSDLTPKVADLMDTAAISVPYDSSVYQAIKLIRDSNLRALPVAAENRCVGILSGWKVTHYLFPLMRSSGTISLFACSSGFPRKLHNIRCDACCVDYNSHITCS